MKTKRQPGKDLGRIGMARHRSWPAHLLPAFVAGCLAIAPANLRAGVVGLPEVAEPIDPLPDVRPADGFAPAAVSDAFATDAVAVTLATWNPTLDADQSNVSRRVGGSSIGVAGMPDVAAASVSAASSAVPRRAEALATIPVHPAAWTGSIMLLAVGGLTCSYRRLRRLLL